MGYSSFLSCDKRRSRQQYVKKDKTRNPKKKQYGKKRKQKYKRVGLCIIFRKTNQMLFLHKRKLLHIAQNKLEIPSGKREKNDMDPRDTMIREAHEELLLNVDNNLIGGSRVKVPLHLKLYWKRILQRKNIVKTYDFTEKETKANDITIGVLFTDEDIPDYNLNAEHKQIFANVSNLFFGGNCIEKRYLPYAQWDNCISQNEKKHHLWKYLEAYDIELINIDDIYVHKNMNFRPFWKHMIPIIQHLQQQI